LIAEKYHLETVISSHDAERPNFSENTDLSEILFIARKRTGKKPAGRTSYISLWRNPRSIHEALDLANRINQVDVPVTVEGAGLTTISGPNGKLGEMISLPGANGKENWTGALFAQSELLRVCWALERGTLRVPGRRKTVPVPLCALNTLGALGPDRKRIHEGFKVTRDDWTPYPAFWNHESAKVLTIHQKPNARLAAWLESPRGPNYGAHLWERAGNILLVERLRSNTHRVLAIGFEKEVLGNTWWALKPHDLKSEQRKALLLWLNSSLSILLFFGRRVITQGAWMQMKQPAWETMPVLDVRSLSSKQLKKLSGSYDALSIQHIDSISSLNSDIVRGQIDKAISSVLEIPDPAFVRELLDREPGLSASEISPRAEHPALEIEEDGDDTQSSFALDEAE
jgi:hypothetical protein